MSDIYSIDKLIEDGDIPYEEAISKDPINLENWLSYLNHVTSNQSASIAFHKQVFILHRATTAIPRSKQLWQTYIKLLLDHSNQLNYTSHKDQLHNINKIFERAITSLLHVPGDVSIDIWKPFLEFLMKTQINEVSYIRRTFNKCLRGLPLNQHKFIWSMYLEFADFIGGLTAIKIYSKYLQYLDPQVLRGIKDNEGSGPSNLEDFIYKFIEFGANKEIFLKLYQLILSKPDDYLGLPKSPVQYLFEYIDLLMDSSIPDLYFDDIIQDSITQFPDQIANLYAKLSAFYKQRGNPEKVRYYYDKGLKESLTVQDFTMIYDHYTEFEEQELNILAAKLDSDANLSSLFDFKMNKFEKLINDRELLLNDMMLRQNPNNLDVWFTRFEIYKDDLTNLIKTYADALKSINPLKVSTTNNHKLNQIWIKYASIYSNNGDYKTADFIYSKSILSQYIHPDELADLYITWCEMLLGTTEFNEDKPIEILDEILYREYSDINTMEYSDPSIPVQKRITKSPTLWSFYIDLLESFIDNKEQTVEIEKVCTAYDQLIKLKIATVKNIISYAEFLENWQYYERSLTIYERGLKIFQDPIIKYEIWKVYIAKIINSPITIEIERVRDLFENCLDDIPPHLMKPILIIYSKYEQDHGYVINSIKVLTESIPKISQAQSSPSFPINDRKQLASQKLDIYIMILAKLDEIQDIPQYRQFAQQAIQDQYFSLAQLSQLFIHHFLKLETRQPQSQQQKQRIRELFKYVTNLAHPDKLSQVWQAWEDYELEQGDESSFKDMLRIKRTVAGEFISQKQQVQEISNPLGFVKGKNSARASYIQESTPAVTTTNPDQIDLDM
ncbi:SYF1 [[Candida] subhashii]|uniref:Pre-mRNA-splicing factor SYF1 n=1 Tax=[Candida] subhashii TaxID=561895 RepID=A0A8J5Q4K9_9ASCO|nr:SYF1 [[Candida] subhashii]KAG7660426.1 SYF1 [[Candida] subhashii]